MKRKSVKNYTLWQVFTFIVCSLFAGSLYGQNQRKAQAKHKTYSDAYLHFNDSSIFKYIQSATPRCIARQSTPSIASIEGMFDYKLTHASNKKYFIIVFYGWLGEESRYAPSPVLILDTSRLSNPRYSMDLKIEKNKIEKYSELIKTNISDSYFKNDSAKLKAFINYVNGADRQLFFSDHLYNLGIGGYHPQMTIGILDASSILRFNIRNTWLPVSKDFFDQHSTGNQSGINEEKTIKSSSGYCYKFILFSLTDNEVYESEIIENAYYSLSKKELTLIKH